jgi:hypothetical protein
MTKGRRGKTCAYCGDPIRKRRKKGPPPKYCSDACRLKNYRADDTLQKKREAATRSEQRFLAVLDNPEKRIELFCVLKKHAKRIRTLLFTLSDNLPVELSGTTAKVLKTNGKVAYRHESLLMGIAEQAIAELVFAHAPDRISEAMVAKIITERVVDEIRKSEEFARPRKLNQGGEEYRPTERVEPEKQASRHIRQDPAGDRVVAILERSRLLDELPEHIGLATFFYLAAKQSERALAGVIGGRPELYEGFATEGTGRDPIRAAFEAAREIGYEWTLGKFRILLGEGLKLIGEPRLPDGLGDALVKEHQGD